MRFGIGLVVMAGAGASCTGEDPAAPTPEYEVKLTPDKNIIDADTKDYATLAIRVDVTNDGDRPRTASLKASSPGALFLSADSGSTDGGGTLVQNLVNVTLAAGKGTAVVKCMDADGLPRAGAFTITASIKVGEDTVDSPVARLTCRSVADNAKVVFVSPIDGDTVNSASRQPVVLQVKDFDDTPADKPQGLVISTTSNFVQMAATADSPATVPGQPLTVDVQGGDARFYVLYPGDSRTLAGSLSMTFKASFRSTLGGSTDASLSFLYARAPNNAEVRFYSVKAVTEGDTNVFVTADTPPTADVTAAALPNGNAVEFTIEIKDRAGQPPPVGTPVFVNCRAVESDTAANPRNCASMTLIPAAARFDGGTPEPVAAQTQGWVLSTREAATAELPERALARVVFSPGADSTAGHVVLSASFTPENSPQVSVPEGEYARVRLVDPAALSASVSVVPPIIDSSLGQSAVVAVSVRRGTTVAANRAVCWTMSAQASSRSRMTVEGVSGQVVGTVLSHTDANGLSRGTVTAANNRVRGNVEVQITVVGQENYQGNTCPTLLENKNFIATVGITRPSILQSLQFISAEPAQLGVQGSGIASTSVVTFRLWNDEGRPEPDQLVQFSLENNGDQAASVLPLGTTNSDGFVTTYVSAGQQAVPLVVKAVASRGTESVNASADPIAVVGGKPAWAPMHVGIGRPETPVFQGVDQTSQVVYAPNATGGYVDPFGPQPRPVPTPIRVQLVDRFSNRVRRPAVTTGGTSGYKVQFRSETGSIPPEAYTTEDGYLQVEYVPGPPYSMDTVPLATEQREFYNYRDSHQDAPQEVGRVGNPRDGLISVLIATRGEESFLDLNGDGAFQRPYNDANGNGRYDGPSEDCAPCTDLPCTRIDNVPEVNSAYSANIGLVEPFVDLPEPFTDKNGDGLRANCDVPDFTMLPVHHDPYMYLAGLGTYCNPYFASEPSGGLTGVSIFQSNESDAVDQTWCRAHWCPDWEPSWNCSDVLPPEVANVEGRTPEALFRTASHYDSPNPGNEVVVGGRILWCPEWRYRDLVDATSGQPIGRATANGVVGHRGVRGIVVPDAMLPGTQVSLYYRYDATAGAQMCMEVKPSTACSSGSARWTTVNAPNHFVGGYFVPAFRVFSGDSARNDQFLYLQVEPGEMGTAAWNIAMRVVMGDQRAPFSEFDRSQLRIYQTDQYIDGNNNNVWDDVNQCYDPDTLIYKEVTLTGVGDLYFSNVDWREATPRTFGYLPQTGTGVTMDRLGLDLNAYSVLPGAPKAGVFDRMQAFVHLLPDFDDENQLGNPANLRDYISPTNHTGGSDRAVLRGGTGGKLSVRMADANGNWVSPYETGVLRLRWLTPKPQILQNDNQRFGPQWSLDEIVSFPEEFLLGVTDFHGGGVLTIPLSVSGGEGEWLCHPAQTLIDADGGMSTHCVDPSVRPPVNHQLTVEYAYNTGTGRVVIWTTVLDVWVYSKYGPPPP